MAGDDHPTADQKICDLLDTAPGHARFVEELFTALQHVGIERDPADAALDDLARRGEIVVRRNHCADPHLDTADLRVVARAVAAGTGTTTVPALDTADAAAQRLWNRWLADFLSSHRCT